MNQSTKLLLPLLFGNASRNALRQRGTGPLSIPVGHGPEIDADLPAFCDLPKPACLCVQHELILARARYLAKGVPSCCRAQDLVFRRSLGLRGRDAEWLRKRFPAHKKGDGQKHDYQSTHGLTLLP
jgi:hypothetical protein